MPYDTLLLEQAEGVATLSVNRPEKRNALNATARRELLAALDQLRHQPEVRVLVITGVGSQAFVAGADIRELAERTAEQQRQAMATLRVFDAVAEYPKPVIAMINGAALGAGCELALACDIRIAAASAHLGQPEIRLGLIPGGGGTQRLPRLVGMGAALRLILTGEPISAPEAWRLGLVDEVRPDAELREHTLRLARSIAAHSPFALGLAKQAVRSALELPLSEGLAREREAFLGTFDSADGREGVTAFLQQRRPAFTGS